MLASVIKNVRDGVASAGTKPGPSCSNSQSEMPGDVNHHNRLYRRSNAGRASCVHDLTKAVSLLALCVGLIVKGVSYDNSHWANQNELDVVNNKDHFPIMTSFIDNMKSGKHENCEDPKCRIFFDKYAAMQTLSAARGSGSVPLRGTVSRGVNRRCERIALAQSSDVAIGSSSVSKYEKCTIDKQSEVNEFKTIRYLLVSSMICDAFGLLNWIAILSYSGHPSRSSMARLFLVTSALCGFLSALLTALGLGLFAQAVDVFEDAGLYLGWPFYAVCATTILSMITAFTDESGIKRNYHSPTVSVIDMTADEFEAYPVNGVMPLPAGFRCNYAALTRQQYHQGFRHNNQRQAKLDDNYICEDDIASSSATPNPVDLHQPNSYYNNRPRHHQDHDSPFKRV